MKRGRDNACEAKEGMAVYFTCFKGMRSIDLLAPVMGHVTPHGMDHMVRKC